MLTACDDNGVDPSTLHFGEIGEVWVQVEKPLQTGIGELQQVLSWSSNGAWRLQEQISYGNVVGDETLTDNRGEPGQFAAGYSHLINSVNSPGGTSLFIPDLDPGLIPDCGIDVSTVRFHIRDNPRGEERQWIRCASGHLSTLRIDQATGPDPEASRVINAAIEARNRTVGRYYNGPYDLSLPFATIEKGDRTGARLSKPEHFIAPEGAASDDTPESWLVFWDAHSGGENRPEPKVDWATEMVLVGAVGEREEAGDSVEIRGILPQGDSTRVNVFERIPGNFCAPGHRIVWPFHIVIAPKALSGNVLAPLPLRFKQEEERVPCAG